MVRSIGCFVDLEGPLVTFPGFLQFTQVSQYHSDVVDSYSHVRMVRSIGCFVDLESPFEDSFSPFIIR